MNSKNIWNIAGIAGLALGGISTAYMFMTQWATSAGMSGFLLIALNSVLWLAKFGGCIWIMRFFMLKYASQGSDIKNTHTFRFGVLTALLSALVFAAASFANIAFISADLFDAQIETMLQQMAPMMDSNSMGMVDKITANMPQISFFSNLIYCFAYGTVLSLILSRNIPSQDPFADYRPKDQQ